MGPPHAIAVTAAMLGGLGFKLLFFAPPISAMDSSFVTSLIADAPKTRQSIAVVLPAEEVCDMTLVFTTPGCE